MAMGAVTDRQIRRTTAIIYSIICVVLLGVGFPVWAVERNPGGSILGGGIVQEKVIASLFSLIIGVTTAVMTSRSEHVIRLVMLAWTCLWIGVLIAFVLDILINYPYALRYLSFGTV
jgi:hypothetical protein